MSHHSSETHAHQLLKAAALRWVQERGFSAAAREVPVPASPYRADVAAYRPSARFGEAGDTIILECKQARADLRRDAHDLEAARARHAHLVTRLQRLEALLAVHRPDLRRGETLFPELDTLELASWQHRGHHRLSRELAQVERQILGGTKFHRLLQWRCANLFVLVAIPGILDQSEIPRNWGVLEPVEAFEASEIVPDLRVVRPPAWQEAPLSHRLTLLERIARRNTRTESRAAGLQAPGRPSHQK